MSRVLVSVPWVKVKGPAFHSHFYFVWLATSSSHMKIIAFIYYWLTWDDSHALVSTTSLMRIFLCWMVEYGLSVVNATSFLCCSSVTDHLLSAMPHLSIKTRCRIILLFLFSGGMCLSSIQETLIEGYKISLR